MLHTFCPILKMYLKWTSKSHIRLEFFILIVQAVSALELLQEQNGRWAMRGHNTVALLTVEYVPIALECGRVLGLTSSSRWRSWPARSLRGTDSRQLSHTECSGGSRSSQQVNREGSSRRAAAEPPLSPRTWPARSEPWPRRPGTMLTITLKTLQQQTFKIEIEAEVTVSGS